MDTLNGLVARAKVLATSVVTYATAAIAIITIVITAADIPEVTQYGGVAITLLAGVIVIVRRVSPVTDKTQRGLL